MLRKQSEFSQRFKIISISVILPKYFISIINSARTPVLPKQMVEGWGVFSEEGQD